MDPPQGRRVDVCVSYFSRFPSFQIAYRQLKRSGRESEILSRNRARDPQSRSKGQNVFADTPLPPTSFKELVPRTSTFLCCHQTIPRSCGRREDYILNPSDKSLSLQGIKTYVILYSISGFMKTHILPAPLFLQ